MRSSCRQCNYMAVDEAGRADCSCTGELPEDCFLQNTTPEEALAKIVNLAQDFISFFEEYIRQHDLTNYIDESEDVDHPKEIECYLVPKAEVDTLRDKFKTAALAHWGINLQSERK